MYVKKTCRKLFDLIVDTIHKENNTIYMSTCFSMKPHFVRLVLVVLSSYKWFMGIFKTMSHTKTTHMQYICIFMLKLKSKYV